MSKRWINYLNIKKPHLSSVFISKRSWYASRIIFRPEPLSLTGNVQHYQRSQFIAIPYSFLMQKSLLYQVIASLQNFQHQTNF